MIYLKKTIISIFLFTMVLSNNLDLKPITFIYYSSEGSDWIYNAQPITIFGVGMGAYYKNDNLTIDTKYLQFGMLGNINNNFLDFSPRQSFPYIDDSKDADGYWTEYATAKIKYRLNNFEIDVGKFDRHWGPGIRALHISNKVPSYPQFGFEWSVRENIKLIYFHGFLNSNIPDSTRLPYYNNGFSNRSVNISRNIAAHRIEWSISEKVILSANESVIYATRSLDFHYLLPIILFYPIENYLGDTDNIQMGCDISYYPNIKHKFYLGFFMDEFTPEWIINSKNHNWFAWQLGYNTKNILLDNESITIEYNWTDQRIYKHKYPINDYYSHYQPLGFWAGPHAQELLVNYFFLFRKNKFFLKYSNVKRGIITPEMVEDNYQDNQGPRFELGTEIKSMISLIIERSSKIQGLDYKIGINNVDFKNVVLDPLNLEQPGIDSNKLSVEIGLFYNFIYN